MTDEAIKIMRKIFKERLDNTISIDAFEAWASARDVVEYALENNIDVLKQFDYGEEKWNCLKEIKSNYGTNQSTCKRIKEMPRLHLQKQRKLLLRNHLLGRGAQVQNWLSGAPFLS